LLLKINDMRKIIFIVICIVSNTALAQLQYPGFEVIGKSYNVFGEYANAKSIGDYDLFDFSKMSFKTNAYNHSVPKLVRIKDVSNHVVQTVEGSSKKEYINSLSESTGLGIDAFFFKASIDHQLDKTTTNTSDYLYYTYMDINTKWKISLDTRNIDTLISYLDLQFKSDLETMDPESLFELYGTHFIGSAYLGGRIDYSTTTQLDENVTIEETKLAIDAKYKSINGGYESDENNTEIVDDLKTSTNLIVVGGNAAYTNNINDYEKYKLWADGIYTKPVLSGFDKRSLKPIWVLTKSESRKKELKDYFTNVVLTKYPLPSFYKKDNILDNETVTQKFNVNIIRFDIIEDCDTPTILTPDEAGDFKYEISVYANGKLVKTVGTKKGYVNRIWSGNPLNIDKNIILEVPLLVKSNIKVVWSLNEDDAITEDDNLGSYSTIHNYPFAISDLYNKENEGYHYYQHNLSHSSSCKAKFYYRISEIHDKTALEFGNKGWTEFENKNYDQCLYYSREALKVDNTLWFIHFNVALVYLIQENPRAFEKYKFTTSHCTEKSYIEAALKDINDYESKNGILNNSEPIKLWLKSKI
jgi:hypothetical protein